MCDAGQAHYLCLDFKLEMATCKSSLWPAPMKTSSYLSHRWSNVATQPLNLLKLEWICWKAEHQRTLRTFTSKIFIWDVKQQQQQRERWGQKQRFGLLGEPWSVHQLTEDIWGGHREAEGKDAPAVLLQVLTTQQSSQLRYDIHRSAHKNHAAIPMLQIKRLWGFNGVNLGLFMG